VKLDGSLRRAGFVLAIWLLTIVVSTSADHTASRYLLAGGAAAAGLCMFYLYMREGRTGARLEHAEVQREVATRSAGSVSWEANALGDIVAIGEGTGDLFGYTREELSRLNLRELVHPEEFERLAA
jgi:PAS domain-containing protein